MKRADLWKKALFPAMLWIPSVLTTVRSQDIGLWSGVGLEKKLNKAFSVKAETQFRFSDNVSTLRSFLAEAGMEYKINKRWSVEGYYRWIQRRKLDKSTDEPYYQSRHRFYANLNYDTRLAPWLRFEYRLRYQNQFRDDAGGLSSDGNYLRNKLELAYRNKSRFTPFGSADFFYLLGAGFDQVRLKAGVNAAINKKNSIGISVFTDYPFIDEVANGAVFTIGYKTKW